MAKAVGIAIAMAITIAITIVIRSMYTYFKTIALTWNLDGLQV